MSPEARSQIEAQLAGLARELGAEGGRLRTRLEALARAVEALEAERDRWKKQAKESQLEAAACLEFLASELSWELFRERVAQEHPAITAHDQNIERLEGYLSLGGHARRLAEELRILRAVARGAPSLAGDALAVIESAYATEEWLRHSRTADTDRTLEILRQMAKESRRGGPGACPSCGSPEVEITFESGPTGVVAPDGGQEERGGEILLCLSCGARETL